MDFCYILVFSLAISLIEVQLSNPIKLFPYKERHDWLAPHWNETQL